MINASQFAERLEELMFYAGTNGVELSVRTGIDEANIYKYLNAVWLPSSAIAIKLADYFKCTLDFLFARTDENTATTFKECPPFAQRLREIIEKSGKTKAQIINKCGVSEAVFYRWLNGKRAPTADSIARLADGLERSMDYIVGREI